MSYLQKPGHPLGVSFVIHNIRVRLHVINVLFNSNILQIYNSLLEMGTRIELAALVCRLISNLSGRLILSLGEVEWKWDAHLHSKYAKEDKA